MSNRYFTVTPWWKKGKTRDI